MFMQVNTEKSHDPRNHGYLKPPSDPPFSESALLTVTATIRNSGSLDRAEVAQLYVGM